MTISASTPLRFVVLLTSIALAFLLLLTGAVVARADEAGEVSDPSVVVPVVVHEVRSGDTLWDIAAGYTLPGDDVREMIHDIKARNDLDSSAIEAGQVLVIPVEF